MLMLATAVFAQGRDHGAGAGAGVGRGSGGSGGPPPNTGVDRGLGNASDRSGGRSDDGLNNASTRSNGRSDDGIDRARQASSNLRHADDDLRDHPNLPHALHTNANDLRSGYQTALATNPDLSFGNYVSAVRLGQNLNGRFPGVTTDAILNGLASGRSLGQTLQDLGLSNDEAKAARKQADADIKAARKHD